MRQYGWLLNELPFTRKQLDVLSDCLEAYGRAIVSAQQQVPVIRQIFSRLRTVLEQDILADRVPVVALEQLTNSGTTSFVYKVESLPVPSNEKSKNALYNAGLISPEELRSQSYLAIKLHYEYDFTEPSDVFRFVNKFAASPTAIKLAIEKLNC
jgi:hypothetical protein